MKTATVSDFRQNLKEHLEAIESDQDFLLLSGPKKKGFVVLTLEQFESMEETAHLLSTPANAARLAKSLKQAEQGKVVLKKAEQKRK
jgi:antitoxin YefM